MALLWEIPIGKVYFLIQIDFLELCEVSPSYLQSFPKNHHLVGPTLILDS